MAFQVGEIKISGTIDDLSFYNSQFGWLVRRKGGPSRKQFKNSPSFSRARENSSEFTNCSRAASIIRKLVLLFLKGAARRAEDSNSLSPDKQLYHRLITLMRLLANEDKRSARGSRHPFNALSLPNTLTLLKNFQITQELDLYSILRCSGLLKPTKQLRRKKVNITNTNRSLSLHAILNTRWSLKNACNQKMHLGQAAMGARPPTPNVCSYRSKALWPWRNFPTAKTLIPRAPHSII